MFCSVIFAHANRTYVKVGDQVKFGDKIYQLGNTGFSTGPHAHIAAVKGKHTKPWYRDDYLSDRAIPLEKETNSFEHPKMFMRNGNHEQPYVNHDFWEERSYSFGTSPHYAIDVVTDLSYKGYYPDGLWTKDVIGTVLAVGDDSKVTKSGYGKYVIVGYESDTDEKGSPITERKFGIDISEFQDPSRMNYTKLSEQIDFAILRVGGTFRNSQGRYYDDDAFQHHYSGFKGKIPMGAYWYSIANTYENGKKEAEYMLQKIAPYKFEYPIVIDVEEPTCTTEGVLGFVKKIEEAGYYAMIYANTEYLVRRLDQSRLRPYDIWLANWTKSPNSPLPYGIWQYTSHGILKGYVGNLDLNYAYKDYPQIIKDAKLNPVKGKIPPIETKPEPIPAPAPLPKTETYIVQAGDTLIGIADKVNKLNGTKLTYKDLADINNLPNPNLIQIGEVLKLTRDYPLKPLVYTVKAGDTLGEIARKFGTTYQELATINGLRNPHIIHIGQEIKLQGGAKTQFYTVKAGDTLSGIADRFNSSLVDILRLNTISNPDLIHIGQKIRVK